jgi:drug/metabolite transporter (DMT)-like permease
MQQSISSDVRRAADQSWLLVSLMLLVDSVHFIFARLLLPYISPDVSAMYVQAVGTLMFGVYAVSTGQLNWGIFRRYFWFFIAIGALIGLSTNMSYTAIAFIDPGTASLLGRVSTIFSLAFGVF